MARRWSLLALCVLGQAGHGRAWQGPLVAGICGRHTFLRHAALQVADASVVDVLTKVLTLQILFCLYRL